jgi:hypothetical protein
MIRVGYLRWEIEVANQRSTQDTWANDVILTARPSYRNVRIKWSNLSTAQKNFIHGDGNFAAVLAAQQEEHLYDDVIVPDVGPRAWRYTLSDRDKTPVYWMTKVKKFASAFAMEVVGAAGAYTQLVLSNPILRGNYARLVELEIFRVIDGTSKPLPTIIDEKMEVDVTQHVEKGVPELVAAILVRDVFEPAHFEEFAQKDHVTIKGSDGCTYRIPRRTHGLIEVWDQDRKPKQRLCVIFKDPGMPPCDEVAMKYLLIKHNIEMLWKIGVKFPFNGKNTDVVIQ